MLVSSEASPLLLYVHVHVYVYHVHIHFFYSVSDCASGCYTLLVVLFLAVMYLSIYIACTHRPARKQRGQHEARPYMSTSTMFIFTSSIRLCFWLFYSPGVPLSRPTGLFFVLSWSRSPPAEGSHSTSSHPHISTSPHSHIPTFPASPHPHIPTFPAHTNGDPSPLDQIARSCQLVCPSSNIALTTKVAWGITGFRYSWSPAGHDDFPCRPPYTCAGFAIHIRQNSCWLTSTKSRKAVSVYPKGTRLQRTQGWTIKWCPHPPNVRMLR